MNLDRKRLTEAHLLAPLVLGPDLDGYLYGVTKNGGANGSPRNFNKPNRGDPQIYAGP